MKRIIMLFSSCFGLGYLPASGTFASGAGVLLYYFIKGSPFSYGILTSALIVAGVWLGTRAEKILGRKDPGCVVVDEVAGMLLALAFLPYDLRLVILGFIVFRILDVFKPYPADKLQELPGGLGVMADDIIAGLYTNIILQAVLRLASFRGS